MIQEIFRNRKIQRILKFSTPNFKYLPSFQDFFRPILTAFSYFAFDMTCGQPTEERLKSLRQNANAEELRQRNYRFIADEWKKHDSE